VAKLLPTAEFRDDVAFRHGAKGRVECDGAVVARQYSPRLAESMRRVSSNIQF
jgi:hypothetical protein